MLTPLEVQTAEFSKSFRGYNEKEVDEFLNEVMMSMEQLINENIDLKEKSERLEKEIKRYSTIEKTLSDTLVVAKQTADNVADNAEKKAEVIIEKAEEEAKRKIHTANHEVLQIRNQYEEAKKEMIVFKTRFKTLLHSQMEIMSRENID